MKSDLRVAAIICTLFLVVSTTASGDDTVVLPGGKVTLSTSPASIQFEEDSLFVVRLNESAASLSASLKKAGVNLYLQIDQRTWWATSANRVLPASVSVSAVYRPQPEDKIVPMLKRRLANAKSSENTAVRVSFLPGITAADASAIVESVGATSSSSLLYGDSMEVRVPANTVSALAASDKIIAIEPGGKPRRTFNRRAVKLSRADIARADFGLSGDGIVAGVWDGGPVYVHKEFKDRLIIAEGGRSDDHATHVAGTIGATGLKTKARGFAPKATIVSYNFNGDVAFKISKSLEKYGVGLANNSWGLANGWEWEGEWVWYGDEYFGSYSADAKAFDEMIAKTGLIVVFAAGNDREDDGAGNGRYYDWADSRYKTNTYHAPDGPYDTIGEVASAKNVITVGAAKDNGPMTSFSSWGPVDDGRIKPEIIANGQSLYSTVLRNRYGNSSGTSMATPAVTGGLTLVSEMWQRVYGERLQADMARALLAATAIDSGRPGPDYSYGFGIMDVQAMVELIDASETMGTAQYGTVLPSNNKQSFSLNVPAGTKNLRVAIAWIDPAAAPLAEVTLVNDLDLVLVAPNGSIFRPWKLNPAAPTANATRGINKVDNIELVEIDTPQSGSWKITVEGISLGQAGGQVFALVATASSDIEIN